MMEDMKDQQRFGTRATAMKSLRRFAWILILIVDVGPAGLGHRDLAITGRSVGRPRARAESGTTTICAGSRRTRGRAVAEAIGRTTSHQRPQGWGAANRQGEAHGGNRGRRTTGESRPSGEHSASARAGGGAVAPARGVMALASDGQLWPEKRPYGERPDSVAEDAAGLFVVEYDHGAYSVSDVRRKRRAFAELAARQVWGVSSKRRRRWLCSHLHGADIFVVAW